MLVLWALALGSGPRAWGSLAWGWVGVLWYVGALAPWLAQGAGQLRRQGGSTCHPARPVIMARRFHFMWTCVSADPPSSAPLLSPYFPFFHCRGSDFVTGFEEPDSALLPSSGSPWSSSISFIIKRILNYIF